MSEATTYEIELDALPGLTLERDHPFQQDIGIQAHEFDATTESNSPGFNSRNNACLTTVPSGFRMVNLIKEEKSLYLLGACMGIFAVGLNDTATGANLPSIQDHYNLPYAVVSLVFLAGFVGYFVSCMANSVIESRIGTRCVLVVAGVLYAGGSLLISLSPPFPALMAGLALMGFGGGFYDACLTSVISHFENRKFMSIAYAFYGTMYPQLGALVAPFISGALAKTSSSWNLYYWFPFSLAVLVTASHFFLFRHYVIPSEEGNSGHEATRTRVAQIARMPLTWATIVLIFVTFAISPTLGSWLTSYLIEVKGSGPELSRYQLSVFWAGLTLGRIFFSLPFVNLRARSGNIILLLSVCGTIAVFWVVDFKPSDWITIGVAGFLLGPNNPEILSILSSCVPANLKGSVISATIGLGLTGATIGPLIFGVVVGKVGPGLHILPPVVIVLAALSTLTFWTIPRREKHD